MSIVTHWRVSLSMLPIARAISPMSTNRAQNRNPNATVLTGPTASGLHARRPVARVSAFARFRVSAVSARRLLNPRALRCVNSANARRPRGRPAVGAIAMPSAVSATPSAMFSVARHSAVMYRSKNVPEQLPLITTRVKPHRVIRGRPARGAIARITRNRAMSIAYHHRAVPSPMRAHARAFLISRKLIANAAPHPRKQHSVSFAT